MFLQLHLFKWPVGGSIYKPHWESIRLGRNPAFLLLTELWPASGQHWPDAFGHENCCLEPYWCWPDSGTQRPVTLLLSIRSLLLTPVVAEPLDRGIRSLSTSVRSNVRSPLWARFFTILRTAWFQSSALSCCGWLALSFDLCLHESISLRIPLEISWLALFWVLLAFFDQSFWLLQLSISNVPQITTSMLAFQVPYLVYLHIGRKPLH